MCPTNQRAGSHDIATELMVPNQAKASEPENRKKKKKKVI